MPILVEDSAQTLMSSDVRVGLELAQCVLEVVLVPDQGAVEEFSPAVGLGNTIRVDDLRFSAAAWGGKAAM
jgi:hypothetical protein